MSESDQSAGGEGGGGGIWAILTPEVRFFLLIAGVSVVLAAAFGQAFSGAAFAVIGVAVGGVMVISITVWLVLQRVGYFIPDTVGEAPAADPPGTADADADGGTAAVDPERGRTRNKPLPPLINFREEIETLDAHFGPEDEYPRQYETFRETYLEMKQATENRYPKASDLRAALNPVTVLAEGDDEAEAAVEEIGDRLFRYLDADSGETLQVTSVTFTADGETVSVGDVDDATVEVRATVKNIGEYVSAAQVRLQFLDASGRVEAEQAYLVEDLPPNAERTIERTLYVDAAVAEYRVSVD